MRTAPQQLLTTLVSVAGLAVSYALVRRGRVQAGVLLAILLMEAAIWAGRVTAGAHASGEELLFYLGIPLVAGGLLLGVRAALLLAAATLLSGWALEALIDQRLGAGFDAEDAALAIYLLAVSTLTVAAAAIGQGDARRLDESEEQLRQVAENIPEVFFIVAADFSRTFYVSPAYEAVWGRGAALALADPLDWTKGVHPDDLPAVRASLQDPASGPTEFRVVQPSGAIRHVRSQVFPVRDPAGAVTRFVGVSQDVTAAKEAAERLNEANGRLRAAAVERQRMFQQIAHDLANPLNPITLQLGILARPGADVAKALPVLRRNVEHLKRQVEDLRDLARIEGHGLRLQVAALDVAALVREAAASFGEVAREAGVALEADAAGPAPAQGDAARLLQVLYNLLSNAIKFTPAGGQVRLRCVTVGDRAEVAVQDSGRGLDPEETARLFKPFSQVHAAGEVAERGIGLGLFIAKGIVEAHGGTLRVQSEGRGKGAAFIFGLPLGGPA
jgi:PAS domain S-box-containing protein